MRRNYWKALSIVILVLPVLWWVRWTRGQEVARSRHEHYTVVIHQAPQPRFWFNLIGYWADSGEYRSTLIYSFTVYSDHKTAPITSFSTPNTAFESWETATIKVKWRSSDHFVIRFDNFDTFDCKFEQGRSAVWRHL